MSKKRQAPNVPPEAAIRQLKREILDHVRLLASGRIMTAYPIVERGKELIALEASLPPPERREGEDWPDEDLEETAAVKAEDF